MPTGHLREPISNINRTDIVVVTKCDEDMKPIDFRIIEENMKLRAHQLPFFYQHRLWRSQNLYSPRKLVS